MNGANRTYQFKTVIFNKGVITKYNAGHYEVITPSKVQKGLKAAMTVFVKNFSTSNFLHFFKFSVDNNNGKTGRNLPRNQKKSIKMPQAG